MKTVAMILGVVLFWQTLPALAAVNDDPVLMKLMLDEVEFRKTGGDTELGWDIQAWVGRDLDKFWVKTEGEREDGTTSKSEFQLLYSRAVSAFWDVQLGWRSDAIPDRDWFVVGMQGLAPYFIEMELNLFIAGSGSSGLRVEAEQELPLTQRWMLVPIVELNAYLDDDRSAALGAGLSDLEASLQLRYLVRRNIAPYAALRWEQSFGSTRSFLRDSGGDSSELYFVLGLSAWF